TAESKSADAVKEKTQKLRSAEEFQRNLLLSVFHKFTILLTEHLLTSEAEGRDFNSYWYKWVTGRFKQIFLSQSDEVWKLCSELETSLFTNDIDSHILEIFHQFRALRR
uniref:MIF4G-like type 2 domain-containing protein n=1 Tax=Plectus sambesii TaxID=2011161 RepID=A0A914WDZ4_9BILA